MRPVVVTAILLLVVLMFISDSAAGNPAKMCRTKYPATPCKNKNLGEGWSQMGDNRCVKAFNKTHFGYHDAEMTCRKFPNGHLVSIHNEAELNQVECDMYRTTTRKAHYWIGGHRKEGAWKSQEETEEKGLQSWRSGVVMASPTPEDSDLDSCVAADGWWRRRRPSYSLMAALGYALSFLWY
ncbi:hypothetical protein FQN60_007124 [Etheostoma spectabile]|uniref:C-type lectin domain-containing protein n=1 Tax=Etheostoma spectabile TaxID=54343 RepID=A0A5J5CAE8_9PERO|nr:hypothetical protein FQN60_007124 [Etheostoma spectabile]